MRYLPLAHAARELELSILDVVALVRERGITTREESGGKVSVSLDDYFRSEQERLELNPYSLSQRELLRLVNFYLFPLQQRAETIGLEYSHDEERYHELDSIIQTLREETPERLNEVASNVGDLFYLRVHELYPDFFRTVPIGGREEKGDHAPNPFGIRRGIKQQARRIVDKVSTYFGTDIPTHISMSKERKNYASITYRRRGLFSAAGGS